MEPSFPDPLLIEKYNQPVPRYTSYPTVPCWHPHIDPGQWTQIVAARYQRENALHGIALYLHLPFCESLCTYCGCNKKITANHQVEEAYIAALLQEWRLYRQLMRDQPVIRELHLGGGTPTFFSPANLQYLLQELLAGCTIHPQHAFSIEGHPNNTTAGHLEVLANLGFRRISYGVQDNDPDVQRIINRIQPLENVRTATANARAYGFTSVNYDLIYGLPLQTLESIERTIREIIALRPDRIAFYSYAHVPWTSRAQRLFDESHLPQAEEKLRLYLRGRELLLQYRYADIGMDHFALPSDELYGAWKTGQLHRNFMGYTTQHTSLLLGLGVSAISDAGNAFAQNEKALHDYYARVHSGALPVKKGYILNAFELSLRRYILDISCKGATELAEADIPALKTFCFPRLAALQADRLIEWKDRHISLTPQGHYFLRHVCAAFDEHIGNEQDNQSIFSKAI